MPLDAIAAITPDIPVNACEALGRKIQKLPGDPDLKVGDPAEAARQEKGESRRYR